MYAELYQYVFYPRHTSNCMCIACIMGENPRFLKMVVIIHLRAS